MRHNPHFCVALAVVLSLVGSDNSFEAAHAQQPDASAPSQEIVPLYAFGPRARAMLTLGDGPPAPVVFDTGTNGNLLTEDYAKHLQLKVIGSEALIDASTGKESKVSVVALPEPRLSGVLVSPPTAQTFAYREPDMVGIFGPNSFSGRLVTLELGLSRLRISSAEQDRLPRGPAVPYRNGLPALNIIVAGIPLSAHLDSGATAGLRLSSSLLGKVPLKGPATVVGIAVSASGEEKSYGGQINGDVVIGPLRLKDPEVVFNGRGTGANVGYAILRQLRVVLDPAGKRSWVLDPSGGPGPLSAFAGQFGPRAIRVERGKLIHQRDGRPPFELKYLGGDLFEMPATGDLVQFYRKDGKVISLELITTEGDVVPAERTA